jgi:hypothetical protein
MKRIFTILTLAILPFLVNAQDTIVAWTFPSTSADSLSDVYISANLGRYLSCQYGTWGKPSYHSIHSDYTTDGFLGAPDKCGMATGWDNGADSAYWMVKFKTTGYGSLMLYSKQYSDATNPGPKDFKVQYKLPGSSSPWVDLTTVTCANDWTTGVVNGISIPAACNNQSSQVSIRWLLTSNLDINSNTLLSTGINKIDNIVIKGTSTVGISAYESELISIYPNPNNGNFCIENNGEINKIAILDILGKCVYTNENNIGARTELSGFEKGVYLVQITTKDNELHSQKLIVQ